MSRFLNINVWFWLTNSEELSEYKNHNKVLMYLFVARSKEIWIMEKYEMHYNYV